MKRFLLTCVALSFVAAPLGCSKTTEATRETKVTTPEGETKVTENTTFEQSGKNPPPVSP
jgi:Ni/Co efflux regulator RcnB